MARRQGSVPPAGGRCRAAGTDSPGDDRLGGGAVAGIRVAPSHLVRLLLGLPPLPIEIDKSAMFRPENEYAYLLRERESSYTQRLWVSADDLTLLRGELYDWRSLRLRFRYSPEGYGLFSLLLEEPSGRVVIEVSYRSYELNPELPSDLFTLPHPSGRARGA